VAELRIIAQTRRGNAREFDVMTNFMFVVRSFHPENDG
jgi:hypothetical protein